MKLNEPGKLLTPYGKLLGIARVADLVKKEIKSFWDGVPVSESKITLDGEQMLMIFVYILARAAV